jgi:ADP-ribose pyrophosphatase YjhB (NUDIX family)
VLHRADRNQALIDVEPGRAGSGAAPVRHVHFRDPDEPTPTVVTPSVFVAVREEQGSLLLVRRRDSGAWELPGGRVGIGESAVVAAVRETAEESGLRVQITGLVGLFTDPAHVVRAAVGGEIRQQFVVVLHGWAARDRPARTGTRSSTPPGSPRRLSQR